MQKTDGCGHSFLHKYQGVITKDYEGLTDATTSCWRILYKS